MSNAFETPKAQRPFTGWHMFGIIVLFFGVIITVNITMATFAVKNWTGLVVKNSYVASQNFNARQEAARAQQALGWAETVDLTTTHLGLALTRPDKTAVPVSALKVEIRRPVGDRDVQMIEEAFTPALNDVQIDLPDTLTAGRWIVLIEAEIGRDDPYVMRRDITISANAD